jgi:3-hydroxyisobutyrate dehydrogenase-like beta-hydroxyacid dehydrogenase
MKLINNFLCGVQVASLAEAVVWIERSGLNREQALDFLKKGSPRKSAASRCFGPYGGSDLWGELFSVPHEKRI